MKPIFSPTIIRVALFFVLAISAALRLYHLDSRQPWLDEIGHLNVAMESDLQSVLHGVRGHAAAAPLDYLVLHFFTQMVGPLSLSPRLLYIGYGLFTVFLTYLLGAKVFSPSAGLVAAFILGISPFHIYYSQEIRFYALSVLFGTLSMLYLWEAMHKADWRHWTLWGLVCLAGLYTHYFLIFLFSLELLWVIVTIFEQRRPLAGLWSDLFSPFLAFLIPVLLFVPWYLWANNARLVPEAHGLIPFVPALMSVLSALGSSLVFLLFSPFGLWKTKESWLLAILVVLPFLAALVADNLSGYFFNPRQIVFVLPFSAVLCAGSLIAFAKLGTDPSLIKEDPRIKILSPLVTAIMLAGFTIQTASILFLS